VDVYIYAVYVFISQSHVLKLK